MLIMLGCIAGPWLLMWALRWDARRYAIKYPKCPICPGRMSQHPHYPHLTECGQCRYLIHKH